MTEKAKRVLAVIVVLWSVPVSATDVMTIAEELRWGDAWDRVVESALDRYLQRYEDGPLANVEAAARDRALAEIYGVIKPQVFWEAMGETIAPSIAAGCDPDVLERMFALKSAEEPATPDEQLIQEYASCIRSGLNRAAPLLSERILSATPRVDEIIRQYNPGYERRGAGF